MSVSILTVQASAAGAVVVLPGELDPFTFEPSPDAAVYLSDGADAVALTGDGPAEVLSLLTAARDALVTRTASA